MTFEAIDRHAAIGNLEHLDLAKIYRHVAVDIDAADEDRQGTSGDAKMTSAPDHTPEPASSPTLAALFTGFLGVGLMGFGGVLPLARRMIVEEKRWFGAAEFTERLALCQFLPGGNVINLAVAVGLEFRGWIGAVVALLGLTAAPTTLAVTLGALYARNAHDLRVQHLVAGLAAAAAGLLVATALKMLIPLRREPRALAIILAAFAAIALLRLPLLPVMLALLPISLLLMRRNRP